MAVPAKQINEEVDSTESVDTTYATLEQFDRDQRYIDDHYDELWEEFGEQWIAVHRNMVIAAAPDIRSLLASLDELEIVLPEDVARRKLSKNKLIA